MRVVGRVALGPCVVCRLVPPMDKGGDVRVGAMQIFNGSFGGATLFDNPSYTSPNTVRAALKRKVASKYTSKVAQRDRRTDHKERNPIARDPMDGLFKGEDRG